MFRDDRPALKEMLFSPRYNAGQIGFLHHAGFHGLQGSQRRYFLWLHFLSPS